MEAFDRQGSTYVFADESGKLSDPNTNIVTLTSLIIYGARMSSINAHFNHAKSIVSNWGINTEHPNFEFHASDIFNHRNIWRQLNDQQTSAVARLLMNSIKETRLSFVIVKIDKREKGFSEYQQYVNNIQKQIVASIPTDAKFAVETFLKQSGVTRGIGGMGSIIGLLFGLTTALMHWEKYYGKAEVILDDQFLKGIEAWQQIYSIFHTGFSLLWDSLESKVTDKSGFPVWPRNNPPKWYLGNSFQQKGSHLHFGLQLADFLAYTSSHISDTSNSLASDYSLIGIQDLVPLQFADSAGIWATTSSKKRFPKLPIKFALSWKLRKLLYRKVYSRY